MFLKFIRNQDENAVAFVVSDRPDTRNQIFRYLLPGTYFHSTEFGIILVSDTKSGILELFGFFQPKLGRSPAFLMF